MPTATSPVELVLSRLEGVKASGKDRWMALCPVHDDKKQSLSVTVGADGRAVMYCHGGCTIAAIVAAIGLSMGDLFVDGHEAPTTSNAPVVRQAQGVNARPRLVKSYDYHDADGRVVFQSVRYEPKDFRQRHQDASGEWIWNLNGVTPVLYRLPAVIDAVAHARRVFIVEGEKDADALTELGYVATTNPMGAGKNKWKDTYADSLAGADVVILPDNDEIGREHANTAAASLVARGATVKVVQLPNLPEKGDVSDWLNDGHDVDELEAMIGKTPRWIPAGTKRTRWRLDEIWENDEMMRPPPPVVPYLAWASRSTLLAAREKSGKSTLTGYMAACVSRGEKFLEEPCQRGKVLIIGLEEFIGDTARRLREFNANPTMIEIVDSFAGSPSARLEEIRAHIEAVKPILVIVDSLVALSAGVVTDASHSMQTHAITNGLTDLAHSSAVALVIIHHARKADGKYRDSSAIGGAVDIIAEVFPPEECEKTDPTRRRVRPVGRVPARSVDFRFDGHGYSLVDPSGPQKAPLEQRIRQVVQERPGISTNDVCDSIGEQRQAVQSMVRAMVSTGQLLNDSGSSKWMKLRVPAYQQSPLL